jgi:uncharacterized protein
VDVATTYLLVDGENLDATLGVQILRARPQPEQRPRWERVLQFAEKVTSAPVRGLFFLNASRGIPFSFVAALQQIGFVPIPLEGPSDQKVVDIAIQRTLTALREREGGVMLASHDGDFAEEVRALVEDGREVSLIGFVEFLSQELRSLGVPVHDLEDDVKAFDVGPLPRLRIIPIDRFDPEKYL